MDLSRLRHPRYADVVATLALFFALGGTAYAATIGTSDIRNGAVTTPKLADEAVSHAKLTPNAVTGGDVANDSLTTADLRGIDESGQLTFTLLAHTCGKLTLTAAGMSAGQAAVLTWTGAVPTHVVLSPLKVVDATHIITYACNLSGARVTANGIGIRVITFG
jgi:hypothetical protein